MSEKKPREEVFTNKIGTTICAHGQPTFMKCELCNFSDEPAETALEFPEMEAHQKALELGYGSNNWLTHRHLEDMAKWGFAKALEMMRGKRE